MGNIGGFSCSIKHKHSHRHLLWSRMHGTTCLCCATEYHSLRRFFWHLLCCQKNGCWSAYYLSKVYEMDLDEVAGVAQHFEKARQDSKAIHLQPVPCIL